MSTAQQKLPPKEEDHIVEVSMKHVVLAFGGIVLGSIAVGAGISFARDYAKFKRQKAIVDASGQILKTIFQGGQISWNEPNRESSLQAMTSKRSAKPSDG